MRVLRGWSSSDVVGEFAHPGPGLVMGGSGAGAPGVPSSRRATPDRDVPIRAGSERATNVAVSGRFVTFRAPLRALAVTNVADAGGSSRSGGPPRVIAGILVALRAIVLHRRTRVLHSDYSTLRGTAAGERPPAGHASVDFLTKSMTNSTLADDRAAGAREAARPGLEWRSQSERTPAPAGH